MVLRTYKAIIWEDDPQKPGQRVTVEAENLDEAEKKLEEKYGEGRIYALYNEEDAERPR